MSWKALGSLVLAALLFAPALQAQTNFEISPFLGYRLGGELDDLDFGDSFDFEDTDSYGVTLDFRVSRNTFIEVFYSSQETELELDTGLFFGDEDLFDIDIEYIHAGAMFQWELGQIIPFAVVTGGITQLDPAPAGLDSETRPSLGLGGGVKAMFGDHFGIRLEGRGIGTFIDSDNDSFCRRERRGRCYGYDDSETLWQFEARAGLVFAF